MIPMIQMIVTSVVPLATEGLLLTDLTTAGILRSFIQLKHVLIRYCSERLFSNISQLIPNIRART